MSTDGRQDEVRNREYTWRDLVDMILDHRRELVMANLIAILGTVVSVPVPLLIPMLVDEVLLHKPGVAVGTIDELFPESWHTPVLYISVILVLTLVLRLCALVLSVWQTRQFTRISKDVTYRMRRALLGRLERVAMAEYESLGGGAVASRLSFFRAPSIFSTTASQPRAS
jgi:ATP-binding cassette subfamily C protein